jgi:hypothetical protein
MEIGNGLGKRLHWLLSEELGEHFQYAGSGLKQFLLSLR